LSELPARILEAELLNRVPENPIRIGRHLGEPIEQSGTHPFDLRSLAGKQDDLHGEENIEDRS
jgi:hypothetical protein